MCDFFSFFFDFSHLKPLLVLDGPKSNGVATTDWAASESQETNAGLISLICAQSAVVSPPLLVVVLHHTAQ